VRPPKAAAPCDEGRPKAARQYVVSACIFSFCPALFFQLLPSLVFSAFAQISISGQLGAKNPCIFSFPVYFQVGVCLNIVLVRFTLGTSTSLFFWSMEYRCTTCV
jgi:hypothetical protein